MLVSLAEPLGDCPVGNMDYANERRYLYGGLLCIQYKDEFACIQVALANY